ncbi:Cation-dependent mannose-6-phosphate receptor [Stylophora pistillata]|uniref:Cation-dependent mannose-6-phosphate receptor n=1 Tax=Stylophora pistillata TaxID=50429 RepID=A0A2B4RWP7_STYPI|nr:Cation-dependent mannose-6-phosphate receptor [Stylophora pistillata]
MGKCGPTKLCTQIWNKSYLIGGNFTRIEGSDGRTFDWNTCTPFDDSSVSSSCDQVMVCQVIEGGGNPAGSKDTSFIVDGSGNVVISYGVMESGGHGRQSGTLNSKYACAEGGSTSGGLSVGSVLLIIFFPLVLAYIIIGVLINRYGRGIESIPELLPNHSFWADFPFLVKDGIVFNGVAIKSGCSSLSNKLKKDGYAEI